MVYSGGEDTTQQTTAQLNLELQDNVSKGIKSITEGVNQLQFKTFLATAAFGGASKATDFFKQKTIESGKQTTVSAAAVAAKTRNLNELSNAFKTGSKWAEAFGKTLTGLWATTAYVDSLNKIRVGAFQAKDALEQIPRTMALMESSGVWSGVIAEAQQWTEVCLANQEATESFVNSATSRFVQFEKSITLINTILGLTGVGIKGTTEDIADLNKAQAGFVSATASQTDALQRYEEALKSSKKEALDYAHTVQSLVDNELKNAVSSTEALNASYQVLSSGYTEVADSQTVMTTGLKLAYAGAADASTTMKALTQTMQAYKVSVSDSTKVANVLLQTVNLGITTLPELASGFAQTAVVAKEAGVKIEELGGAVAALTLKGNSTPTALTGLEALFRNIINKTPEAVKALEQLRDSSGKAIRFDIAEIKTKGFTKALQDLNKAVGGNSQLLSDIIPDSLAFSSVLGLMSENAKALEENTTKITVAGKKAAEYLEKAFDIKLGDKAAKFEQIVNRFSESLIKFGEGLAPAFEKGVEALEWAADLINNMSPGIKGLITNVALGTLAFKSFTSAITSMAGGIASAFITFQSFRLLNMLFSGTLGDTIDKVKLLHSNQLGLIPVIKQLIGLDQQHLIIQKQQGIVTKSRWQVIKELREQKFGLMTQVKQLLGIDQRYLLETNRGTEALKSRASAVERYSNSSKKLKEIGEEVGKSAEKLSGSLENRSVLQKQFKDNKKDAKQWGDIHAKEFSELFDLEREYSLKRTTLTQKEVDDYEEAIAKKAKAVADANNEVIKSEEAAKRSKEDLVRNEEKIKASTTEYSEKLKDHSKTLENLQEQRKKVGDAYVVAENAQAQATSARAKAVEASTAVEKARLALNNAAIPTDQLRRDLTVAQTQARTASIAALRAESLATQANTAARGLDLHVTRQLMVAEGSLIETRILGNKVYLASNFITKILTKDLLQLAGVQTAVGKGWLLTSKLMTGGWELIGKATIAARDKLLLYVIASKTWAASRIADINAVIASEGLLKGSQILGGRAFDSLKSLGGMLAKGAVLPVGVAALAGSLLILGDNMFGFGKTAKEALKSATESTKELKNALRNTNSEFYALAESQKTDKGAIVHYWEQLTGLVKGFGSGVKDVGVNIGDILTKIPVLGAAFEAAFKGIDAVASSISKVFENYRYNQIVETLSDSVNATELAGEAWIKAATHNQAYAKGLYATKEISDKVHKGISVTVNDLAAETKAFLANKKEREAVIKNTENHIATLKKLQETASSPEMAEDIRNQIVIQEEVATKLKDTATALQENFDLTVKITQERNKLITRKSLWNNVIISDEDLALAKKNADTAAIKLAEIYNTAIGDANDRITSDTTNLGSEKRFEVFNTKIEAKQAELTKLSKEIEARSKKNINADKEVQEFQVKQEALAKLTKEFQAYNAAESEYTDKTNKRRNTTPEDIGFNSLDTSLKKSIRFSEEALANYFAKLAAMRDGFDKYVDPITKETKELAKTGIAELEGATDKFLQKLESNLGDIQTRFDEGYLNGKDAADQVNRILEMEVESVDKAGKHVKQKIKEFLDPKDVIGIVQQQFAFLTDASNKELARQQDFMAKYKGLQDARLISTKQALKGIAEAEKASALERVETQRRVLAELENNKAGSPEQIEAARRKLDNLTIEYRATIQKTSSDLIANEKNTALKTIQFKTDLLKAYEASRRISTIGAAKELGKLELEMVKTNYAAILKEYENAKKNNLSTEEITDLGRQAVIARELVVNKQFELEESLINKTFQLEREALDRRLKLYRGFIDAKQLTTKEATKKINELEKKQLENDLKEIDKKIELAEKGITPEAPELRAKEMDNLVKPQVDELRNIASLVEKISAQIDKEKPPEKPATTLSPSGTATPPSSPVYDHPVAPAFKIPQANTPVVTKPTLIPNPDTGAIPVALSPKDKQALDATTKAVNDLKQQFGNIPSNDPVVRATQDLLKQAGNIPVNKPIVDPNVVATSNLVNSLPKPGTSIPTIDASVTGKAIPVTIVNNNSTEAQKAATPIRTVDSSFTTEDASRPFTPNKSFWDKVGEFFMGGKAEAAEAPTQQATKTLVSQVKDIETPTNTINKQLEKLNQQVKAMQGYTEQIKSATQAQTKKEEAVVKTEQKIQVTQKETFTAFEQNQKESLKQDDQYRNTLIDNRKSLVSIIQAHNIKAIEEQAEANVAAQKKVVADLLALNKLRVDSKDKDPLQATRDNAALELQKINLTISAAKEKLYKLQDPKLGINKEHIDEARRVLNNAIAEKKKLELQTSQEIADKELEIRKTQSEQASKILEIGLQSRALGEIETTKKLGKISEEQAKKEYESDKQKYEYLVKNNKSEQSQKEALAKMVASQKQIDLIQYQERQKQIELGAKKQSETINSTAALAQNAEKAKQSSTITTAKLANKAATDQLKLDINVLNQQLNNKKLSIEERVRLERQLVDKQRELSAQEIVGTEQVTDLQNKKVKESITYKLTAIKNYQDAKRVTEVAGVKATTTLMAKETDSELKAINDKIAFATNKRTKQSDEYIKKLKEEREAIIANQQAQVVKSIVDKADANIAAPKKKFSDERDLLDLRTKAKEINPVQAMEERKKVSLAIADLEIKAQQEKLAEFRKLGDKFNKESLAEEERNLQKLVASRKEIELDTEEAIRQERIRVQKETADVLITINQNQLETRRVDDLSYLQTNAKLLENNAKAEIQRAEEYLESLKKKGKSQAAIAEAQRAVTVAQSNLERVTSDNTEKYTEKRKDIALKDISFISSFAKSAEEGKRKSIIETSRIEANASQAAIKAEMAAIQTKLQNKQLSPENRRFLEKEYRDLGNRLTTQTIQSKTKEVALVNNLDKEKLANAKTINKQLAESRALSTVEANRQLRQLDAKEFQSNMKALDAQIKIATDKRTKQSPEEIKRLLEQREVLRTQIQAQNVKAISENAEAAIATPKKRLGDSKELADIRSKSKDITPLSALQTDKSATLATIDLEVKAQEDKIAKFKKLGKQFSQEAMDDENATLQKLLARRKEAELSADEAIRQERVRIHEETANTILAKEQNLLESRRTGEIDFLKRTAGLLLQKANQEVANAKQSLDYLVKNNKSETAIQEARNKYALATSNRDKVAFDNRVKFTEKTKEVALKDISFQADLVKTFSEGRTKSSIEVAKKETNLTQEQYKVQRAALVALLDDTKLAATERSKLTKELANLDAQNTTQVIANKHKEVDTTINLDKERLKNYGEVTKNLVNARSISIAESTKKLTDQTRKEGEKDLASIDAKLKVATDKRTRQSKEEIDRLKQLREIARTNLQAKVVSDISENAEAGIADRKKAIGSRKDVIDSQVKAKTVDPIAALEETKKLSIEGANLEIKAQEEKIEKFKALGSKFSKEAMAEEKRNLQKLVAQRAEIELSKDEAIRQERIRLHDDTVDTILAKEQNLVESRHKGELDSLKTVGKLLEQRANQEVINAKETLDYLRKNHKSKTAIQEADNKYALALSTRDKVIADNAVKYTEKKRDVQLNTISFGANLIKTYQEAGLKNSIDVIKTETKLTYQEYKVRRNAIVEQLKDKKLAATEEKKLRQDLAVLDAKATADNIINQKKATDTIIGLDNARLKNQGEVTKQLASARALSTMEATKKLNEQTAKELNNSLVAVNRGLDIATKGKVKQSPEEIEKLKQQRDLIKVSQQAQIVKSISEEAEARTKARRTEIADSKELLELRVKNKSVDSILAAQESKKLALENNSLEVKAQQEKIEKFKKLGDKFSKEAMAEEKRNLQKLVAQRSEIELSNDEAIRQEQLRRHSDMVDTMIAKEQNLVDARQVGELDALKKMGALMLRRANMEVDNAKQALDYLRKNNKSKASIQEADNKLALAISNRDKVLTDNSVKYIEKKRDVQLQNISFTADLVKTYQQAGLKNTIDIVKAETKLTVQEYQTRRAALLEDLKTQKLAPTERAKLTKQLANLDAKAVADNILNQKKASETVIGLDNTRLKNQQEITKQLATARSMSTYQAAKILNEQSAKELNNALVSVNSSLNIATKGKVKQSPEEIEKLKQQREIIKANQQAQIVKSIAEEADARTKARRDEIADTKELLDLRVRSKSVDSIEATRDSKKLALENNALEIQSQEEKIAKFTKLGDKFSKEEMAREKRNLQKLVTQRGEIVLNADENIRQERLRRNQSVVDSILTQEQNLLDTRRVGELEYLKKVSPLLVKKAQQDVKDAKDYASYLKANNKSKADIAEADRKVAVAQSNLEKTVVDNRFKLLDANKNKELANINFLSSATKAYAEGKRKNTLEIAQMENKVSAATLQAEKKSIVEQLKDAGLSKDQRIFFTKQLADVNNRAITDNILAKQKEADALTAIDRNRLQLQKDLLKELADARTLTAKDAVEKALALEMKDLDSELRNIRKKINTAISEKQSPEEVEKLRGQEQVLLGRKQSTTVRGIRERADAGISANRKAIDDNKELLNIRSKTKDVDTIEAAKEDAKLNKQSIDLQIQAQEKKLKEFSGLGKKFNKEAYEEEKRNLAKLVAQRKDIEFTSYENIKQERIRRQQETIDVLITKEQNLVDTKQSSELDYLRRINPLLARKAQTDVDNAKRDLDYLRSNNKAKSAISEAERKLALAQSNQDKVNMEGRFKVIEATKNRELTLIGFLSNSTKALAEGRRKSILEIAQLESTAAKKTLQAEKDDVVERLKIEKLSPENRKLLQLQLKDIEDRAKTERITSKEKEIDILTGLEKELVSHQKSMVKELADARTLSFKETVRRNFELEMQDLYAELADVTKKIANAKKEGQAPEVVNKLERQKSLTSGRIQSTKVRGIEDRANAGVSAEKKAVEDYKELADLQSKLKLVDPVAALEKSKKLSLESSAFDITAQKNKLEGFRKEGDKFSKEAYEAEKRQLSKLMLQRKEIEQVNNEAIRQERLRKSQETIDNLLAQEQNLLETRRYSELEYLTKTSPLLIKKANNEVESAKKNLDRLKAEGKARSYIVEAQQKYDLALSNLDKVRYDTRLRGIEGIKNVEVRNANFLANIAKSYEEGRRKGILETTKLSNKAAQDALLAERRSIQSQLNDKKIQGDQRKALEQQLIDVNNRLTNQTISGKEKETDVVNNLNKEQLNRQKELVKQAIDARAISSVEGSKRIRALELKSTDQDIATLDKKIKQASQKGTELSKEAIKQLNDQRKVLLAGRQTQIVTAISEEADDNIKAAKKSIANLLELNKLQQSSEKITDVSAIKTQTRLGLQDIDQDIKASFDKLAGYKAQGKKISQETILDETRNYNRLVATRQNIEVKGFQDVQQARLRTNQETIDRLLTQDQNYLDARQINELDFLKRTSPMLVKRAKDAADSAKQDLENARKSGKAKEIIAQYQQKFDVAQSNYEKVTYETRSKYIEANKNKSMMAVTFLSNMNRTYEEGRRKGSLEIAKTDTKVALETIAINKNAIKEQLQAVKLSTDEQKILRNKLAEEDSKAINQRILGKHKEIDITNNLDKENLRYQKDTLAQLVNAKAITTAEAVRQQGSLAVQEIDKDIKAIDEKLAVARNKGTKQAEEEIKKLVNQRKLLQATRQSTVVGNIVEQSEANVRTAKKRIEDLKALSQSQVGAKEKSEIQGAIEQANLAVKSIDKDIQASNERLTEYRKQGKKIRKETIDEEVLNQKNLEAQKKQIARDATEKRLATVHEIENKGLQNSLDILAAYRQAGSVDELEAAKKTTAARTRLLNNQIDTEKKLLEKLEKDGADPTYIKDQKNKIAKLQADRKTVTIEGAKELFRIEQDHSNKVISLRRDAATVLNDVQIKSAEDTIKATNKLEIAALQQDLRNRIRYFEMLKRLNPNNKKAIEEAGLEVALVRNRLAAQEITSGRKLSEAKLKDFQTQSDLEINQIKLNKVARNLYEEDEFKAVIKNRLKTNKVEQEYLKGRIADAKKKGQYTVELEKDLSSKLVEEIGIRNERLTKEYEIHRAKVENIQQRQLLGLTKQIDVLEVSTKQLQLEQTLRETNKTLIEATNNANIAALEREGKLRKSITEKADLDLRIAQAQYKNRAVSLQLDKESLRVREAEVRLSLQRQDLELLRTSNETKRQIDDKKNELKVEEATNRDKQKIARLKIELEYLAQREEMNAKEAEYNKQNRKVTEQSLENQRKANALSQDEERKNARVEMRLAVVNKLVAKYEQLIKTEELATTKDSNTSTIRLALNEKLNRAYQLRNDLLEKQKTLLANRDNFSQEQFKFAQGITQNEYLKVRLAKEAALINLRSLDQRQAKEALIMELQIKQTKLALERQKIEQKFSELRAEREEKTAQLNYQKSLINGTPEDQQQYELALREKIAARVLTSSNRENIANQEALDKIQEASLREDKRQRDYNEKQQGVAALQQATGSPWLGVGLIRGAMRNAYANAAYNPGGDRRIIQEVTSGYSPFIAKSDNEVKLPQAPKENIEKIIEQATKSAMEQAKVQAAKDNVQIDKKVKEAEVSALESLKQLQIINTNLESIKQVVNKIAPTISTSKKEPELRTWKVDAAQMWEKPKVETKSFKMDGHSAASFKNVTQYKLGGQNPTKAEEIKSAIHLKIERSIELSESINQILKDIRKNIWQLVSNTNQQQKATFSKETRKEALISWKMAGASTTSNSVSGVNRDRRLAAIDKDIDSLKGKQQKVIAFVGDSITAAGKKSNSIFAGRSVLNLGVSGDRTDQVANRLPSQLKKLGKAPDTLVLLAGINDLRQGKSLDSIVANIQKTVTQIRKDQPNTKVILESVLPTRLNNLPTSKITELNKRLEKVAKDNGASFLNLVPSFVQQQNKLQKIYTTDGLHLSKRGYQKLDEVLRKAVGDKKASTPPLTSWNMAGVSKREGLRTNYLGKPVKRVENKQATSAVRAIGVGVQSTAKSPAVKPITTELQLRTINNNITLRLTTTNKYLDEIRDAVNKDKESLQIQRKNDISGKTPAKTANTATKVEKHYHIKIEAPITNKIEGATNPKDFGEKVGKQIWKTLDDATKEVERRSK